MLNKISKSFLFGDNLQFFFKVYISHKETKVCKSLQRMYHFLAQESSGKWIKGYFSPPFPICPSLLGRNANIKGIFLSFSTVLAPSFLVWCVQKETYPKAGQSESTNIWIWLAAKNTLNFDTIFQRLTYWFFIDMVF